MFLAAESSIESKIISKKTHSQLVLNEGVNILKGKNIAPSQEAVKPQRCEKLRILYSANIELGEVNWPRLTP